MPPADDTPDEPWPAAKRGHRPESRQSHQRRRVEQTHKRRQDRRRKRNARLLNGAIIIVAVALVASVILLAVHPPVKDLQRLENAVAKHTTPATAATSGAPCPLTGTPAPKGAVPGRPALAVKIDNYPDARPQSGLDNADMVFEEPVEGGITRFVAVFQCQESSVVGPLRSARAIDVDIASQLSNPIFVHDGGIIFVANLLDSAPLTNRDIGDYPSAIHINPDRVAPYSTFADTADLWALDAKDTAPPAPLFDFSTTVPNGSPGGQANVDFSDTSDVTWTYDPSTHRYLRSYGSATADLMNGTQISASNVVVQTVHLRYGPWAENQLGGQGSLEVQADLVSNGPVLVLRNGVAVHGRWSRSSLTGPTVLTANGGGTIALQPGPTWVELLPDTITPTAGPLQAGTTK